MTTSQKIAKPSGVIRVNRAECAHGSGIEPGCVFSTDKI